MSVVKIVTGHDAFVARQILIWFARQEECVQIGVLQRKRTEHERMYRQYVKHGVIPTELAALVLAAERSGWSGERAYRSSKSVGREEEQSISRRRQARAGAY